MALVDMGAPAQSGVAGIPAMPAGAKAITPSDTDTFPFGVMIYVGGTGNLTVTPANGNADVVFTAVPVGFVVPLQVKAVKATGTTATALVGLY